MANYDFSTLSSSDLEELVCDLLNADLPGNNKIHYKTFKDGKDKGIDFLHSTTSNPHSHVGQVKHYYRTGIDGLLSHLEKTEVAKAKSLKPGRYIFATSVDLSAGNSKTIKTLFQPFLKNLNDIYGKKDLNRLLEEHEQVLDNHYKLWFNDTTILKKILNSDLDFRSVDFIEHELTKRIRLYVKTNLFNQARKSLDNHNFVIITGNPGVGKTTLAEMLTYEYIKDDYKLIYIIDDIKDAERVLANDDSKQVIYFDDFLGSNAIEINRAQGREGSLLSIIRRVRRGVNKKLIFTTRTFIFNKMQEQSERLKAHRIDAGETVFTLSEYDLGLKATVLRNHIEEADISQELKDVLLATSLFDFVVNHKNFNPRSVEFITSKESVGQFSPSELNAYVLDNFDNPEKIWRHAYLYQIGRHEQLLLNTLVTFEGPVLLSILEEAYRKRLGAEVKTSGSEQSKTFKILLAQLNRGFIQVKAHKVDFLNPSVRDFLVNYLKNDSDEVKRMVTSVRYVVQISQTLQSMLTANRMDFPEQLKMDLTKNYYAFTRPDSRNHDLIQIASLIDEVVYKKEKNEVLLKIIEEITDWESLYKDYSLNKKFMRFVEASADSPSLKAALNVHLENIVNEMVTGEDDPELAITILEDLVSAFEIDFNNFNIHIIRKHFDYMFDSYISEEVENLKDWILDPGEASEKEQEIAKLNQRILNLGFDYHVDLSDFDIDWYDIASDNDFKRLMEKDD